MDTVVTPLKRRVDVVVDLPVQRSSERNEQVKSVTYNSIGVDGGVGSLDDRAKAKMIALTKAKDEMEEAWTTSSDDDGDADDASSERRVQAGRELAHAYSQAIKYTSRLAKSVEATRLAETMLYEWMDEFLRPLGGISSMRMDDMGDEEDVSNTAMYLNKKWTIRTAHEIATRLEGSNVAAEGTHSTATKEIVVRLPYPPSSGDYINLLRAYSSSKARRKGQRCEVLMKNMLTLAEVVSRHSSIDDVGRECVSSDDCDRNEMWRMWVKESIPNSKVFALAIKCHAGSTRPDSLERIILLNHLHDAFADCCQPHVFGLYKDDPYVIFHSIKALKNLQNEEQYKLGKEWLTRIHKFVTNAKNGDYFQEEVKPTTGEVDWDKDQSEDLDRIHDAAPAKLSSPTIDVTAAYTTLIRLMARLRGKDGVATDAREVLDRMHEVQDASFVDGPGKRIASIDIRSNAYNLLLGLYRDSKNVEDASKAIELLERMVDAGRKAPEDRGGVPLPTEASFEYAIMSIAKMTDSEKALDEAERLIKLMQDQEYMVSSVIAYNSYLVVCSKQLFGKPQLYDKAFDVLNRMNELGKINPEMLPSPDTLALIMKACALSEHKDHKKVLDTASNLFLQMKEKEIDDKSTVALTDRAYYYMMKSVDMYSKNDPDSKKEHIQELFSEACQRGLCSANVLSCFRSCVSDEDYRLTVGQGRLADHWIANIKSPRVLYTDGSKGGAGKNARRKGKSTSDWAKKTDAKEVERRMKKSDKMAKKSFKKIMNSSR